MNHLGNPTPSINIESTWAFLKDGIDQILSKSPEGMSYATYMSIYTALYDYCARGRLGDHQRSQPLASSGSKENQFMGREIYVHMENYLIEFVNHSYSMLQNHTGGNLARFYALEWRNYTRSTGYIHHLFRYLNRYWIKREIMEGRPGVYPIFQLSLNIWNRCLFKRSKEDIIEATLGLIRQERDGEAIDGSIIKTIAESFAELGEEEKKDDKLGLELYREHFQTPYIIATRQYYSTESKRYFSEHSVAECMIQVEKRLLEEEERCQKYLHPTSFSPVLEACVAVLVQDHEALLQGEFQNFIDNSRHEDLSRMYKLLHRYPNGLDPLRERFEVHVRNTGKDSVARVLEQQRKQSTSETSGNDALTTQPPPSSLDAKVYVDSLLLVHRQYASMVETDFSGDAGFVGSLDRACKEFVNRNAVCKDSTSRTPELLARYCDILLRTNAKNPDEEEHEALLTDIMVVFKYVEDKDVFQTFYSKFLAKRLVNQTSASDDAEANMISKLKEACGIDYTRKLQQMFLDIGLSKEMNSGFRESLHSQGESLGFDMEVKVLGKAHWPLQLPPTALNLPQTLQKAHELFDQYFNKAHTGRKLNWLWHVSKGEIRVNYLESKTKHIFQVSAYQMAILLAYNDPSITQLTWEELVATTGLTADALRGSLEILVKAKVLHVSDGEKKVPVGTAKSVYALNTGFRGKRVRINLNMPIKSEAKAEDASTRKAVEEDRRVLIHAAIVRIMKTRRTLQYSELMAEVISQLQSRFQPKISDIKGSIDRMMEQEFIERSSEQKDVFHYVA